MLNKTVRGAHAITRVYRARKILIVDGDQNRVGRGHRDVVLSRYGEVHVFRNPVNTEIQGRQANDATWCRYHTSPSSEKEAVDHNISFFCGQHCGEWRRDNVAVTIVSRDKTFRNTKALLDTHQVSCDIIHEIPTTRSIKIRPGRGKSIERRNGVVGVNDVAND